MFFHHQALYLFVSDKEGRGHRAGSRERLVRRPLRRKVVRAEVSDDPDNHRRTTAESSTGDDADADRRPRRHRPATTTLDPTKRR